MLTVLTWFWEQPGGRVKYTPDHVNIWADMVRRNLSIPHRIACVTDLIGGLDPEIAIIEPPRDFEDWRIPSWGPERPQCLRRIAMFGPNAAEIFGEKFVCMDLDCTILGQMDHLFTDDDFRIYKGTAPGRFYNGSMMMIRAGSRLKVYDDFTIEGATAAGKAFIGSDQAWIAHCLGPHERTWSEEDGVVWYKDASTFRKPASIVFFPGTRKPWDLVGKNDKITKNYRRTGVGGRALLLGYASTVWDEAVIALDKGTYDVVIASPEAASQWPGDVFAVANDDAHAEQIALMHGFEDFTWCGRSAEENVE